MPDAKYGGFHCPGLWHCVIGCVVSDHQGRAIAPWGLPGWVTWVYTGKIWVVRHCMKFWQVSMVWEVSGRQVDKGLQMTVTGWALEGWSLMVNEQASWWVQDHRVGEHIRGKRWCGAQRATYTSGLCAASWPSSSFAVQWHCHLSRGEPRSDQPFCVIWRQLLGSGHLYTHPLSLLHIHSPAAVWADLIYISPLCSPLCQEPLTQWCSITSKETGILSHTTVIITKEVVMWNQQCI